MANKLILSIGVAGACLFSQAAHAKSIVVYDQKIDAAKICGKNDAKSGCAASSQSVFLKQKDTPLPTDSTGKPIYRQVLGRTYGVDEKNIFGNYVVDGSIVNFDTCGLDEGYFGETSTPYSFTFTRKGSSIFSLDSGVDVKEALKAAGVPSGDIDNLSAKFKATYGKNIKDNYSISGSYYRVALHTDVVDKLKGNISGDKITGQCRQTLQNDPKRWLVWSISLVKLDEVTFTSNVANKIATDFAADVKAKSANADIAGLKVSLAKDIQKDLSVSFKNEWRVVSWDFFRPI